MQLTEEQRKAIEWAADRFAQDAIREIDPQDKYDFNASATTLRELLAAHNAGAQEPAAYTSADRLKRIAERNRHVDTMWPASMRDEGDIPLYTQPQPMTFGGSHESAGTTPIGIATASEITDAARDAKRFAFLITNIKRYQLRESKGFWYYAPIASQDWQRGYRTAREAIDAAIERGEREGE